MGCETAGGAAECQPPVANSVQANAVSSPTLAATNGTLAVRVTVETSGEELGEGGRQWEREQRQ